MKDRADNDSPIETSDDMVFFGRGGSMPRGLYRRARRLIKLFWIAAVSPFVLLLVCAFVPGEELLKLAARFNDLLWSNLKQISLERCGEKCHMVAYSLVGIPISLAIGLVGAIWAVPLTIESWRSGQEAFRQGAAPFERTSNGIAKPAGGIGIGLAGVVFSGALLLGSAYFLYMLAGSDRTLVRGRETWPALVSFWTTCLMSFTQLLMAMLMAFLTGVVLRLVKRPNSKA